VILPLNRGVTVAQVRITALGRGPCREGAYETTEANQHREVEPEQYRLRGGAGTPASVDPHGAPRPGTAVPYRPLAPSSTPARSCQASAGALVRGRVGPAARCAPGNPLDGRGHQSQPRPMFFAGLSCSTALGQFGRPILSGTETLTESGVSRYLILAPVNIAVKRVERPRLSSRRPTVARTKSRLPRE